MLSSGVSKGKIKDGEDKEEEEDEKIMEVFAGVAIIELKKETLKDLVCFATIKEYENERNYRLPSILRLTIYL